MFHPFYVKDESKETLGNWVAASNLKKGDELLTEDGKNIKVSEVRVQKLEEEITVYNLEITEVHTYYVAGGVLVHNACADADAGGRRKNTGEGGRKYVKASFLERIRTKTAKVSDINPNPLDEFSNPKISPNESAVSKYIKEINTNGTISEPIEVQKLASGGYEIVNGHHRWLAAIKTGLKDVSIKIVNYDN